jgi:tRNA1Val (adenine37-N6)-methyltransferase
MTSRTAASPPASQPAPRPWTSRDAVCRGRLVLDQPLRGYRLNIDSILLPAFVRRALEHAPSMPSRIVDLGAGCGVVGLLAALDFPGSEVLLVEIQSRLAALASENVLRNGLEKRARVICADLLQDGAWATFAPDLVVTNPPYFPLGRGPVSGDVEIALAKHELRCTLSALVSRVATALAEDGRLALVLDARRLSECMHLLSRAGLVLERWRRVLPLPGAPPSRALLLAARSAPGSPFEEDDLVLETRPGCYSIEVQKILGDSREGADL